jgi:hypothetical protein
VVEPNQITAAQAVASMAPGILPPSGPDGFDEFFRGSFREVVRAAMYAGATLQEAEDAANEALLGMLLHWDRCKGSSNTRARPRSTTSSRPRHAELSGQPGGSSNGAMSPTKKALWTAS